MPYKLQKSGDGWYVVDDAGKKYSNKPLSKWRATSQMRALYAREKEVSLDAQLQKIRNSLDLIVNGASIPVQSVASTPVYFWVKEIYEDYALFERSGKIYKAPYTIDTTGAILVGEMVEVMPEWIPMGKCIYKAALLKDDLPASAYLVVEDPEKVTTWHLPVKDADGKPDHRLMGAAWAALHGGYRGNKYDGPGKQEAIQKLRALYASEEMPVPSEKSFRVIKETDGNYRWFTISSSAFKDRDGEIVTAKALEEDVDRCDKSGEYGPLRWWHLGGYETPDGPERWDTWKAGVGVDLGTCDFAMLHGRMLIESGVFKSISIGEAFAEAQDELEVSIAFAHPEGEPGEAKEYQNIHRFERSLLPDGLASNLVTKLSIFKGAKMKIQEKLEALMAILRGKPEVARQILEDATAIQKAAEEAGLEFKEVEELLTPPVEEKQEEPDEIGFMSRDALAAFVTDIVTRAMAQSEEKAAAKEAGASQVMADILTSIKSMAARTEVVEKTAAAAQQSLLELADARPAGVKQLQSLRSSQRDDTVIANVPAGPHMDEGFVRYMSGGTSK